MKATDKNRLIGVSLIIYLLALLVAISRTVCLFVFYDPAIGYLQTNWFTVLLRILIPSGVLLCAAAPLLFRKKTLGENQCCPHISTLLRIPAIPAFLTCGIFQLTYGSAHASRLSLFAGLFCMASALFFLFAVLNVLPSLRGRLGALSPWGHAVTIITLTLLLATAYFDMTVTINGPFAGLYWFSLLACALFLLAEMRRDIGRALPRAHLGISFVAMFLCMVSGTGNFLFSMLGETGPAITLSDSSRPFVLLAMSLYILARILSFDLVNAAAPQQSGTTEDIED